MIFLLFSLLALVVPTHAESLLRIHYQVDCDVGDTSSFPGIIAEIKIGKRLLRSYLVKYQQTQVISLGSPSASSLATLDIRYLRHPTCKLKTVDTQTTEAEDSLALKHSPYLILRSDQAQHPDRDVPLHLGYSKILKAQGFAIRYTMFFSNETDHGIFATTKSKSQAIYGRRTDIEWVYQVDFDSNNQVVSRTYQSGILLGIGHKTRHFKGKFLAGTQHPILYDIAKHNVFYDKPYPGQSYRTTGVHLTPLEELVQPEAREDWMWRNPWSFEISDRELRRTHHLTYASEDYLYIRISGAMNGGKLEITGSGMIMKKITLSKLGEDLWGSAGYVAFRPKLFPDGLRRTGHSITFTSTHPSLQIKKLQFFRLHPAGQDGFKPTEITSLFYCAANTCEF